MEEWKRAIVFGTIVPSGRTIAASAVAIVVPRVFPITVFAQADTAIMPLPT